MIFGKDWAFVQNPKAASSSVGDCLLPYVEPVPPQQLPDGKPGKHAPYSPAAHPWRPHRLGVVRNPWDRMVSGWAYICERKPTWRGISFREFVLDRHWTIGIGGNRSIEFQRTPQMAWLAYCNEVLRAENLAVEFDHWAQAVLGESMRPPVTNTSARSGGYVGYYLTPGGGYDEELIEAVRDWHTMDLEAFDYEFSSTR